MTSMNVSLPEELKKYVESQTEHGYSTPSEYVRELIRADQKRKALETLDAMLIEGLNSGAPTPAGPEFWAELRLEALRKLRSRGKPRRK